MLPPRVWMVVSTLDACLVFRTASSPFLLVAAAFRCSSPALFWTLLVCLRGAAKTRLVTNVNLVFVLVPSIFSFWSGVHSLVPASHCSFFLCNLRPCFWIVSRDHQDFVFCDVSRIADQLFGARKVRQRLVLLLCGTGTFSTASVFRGGTPHIGTPCSFVSKKHLSVLRADVVWRILLFFYSSPVGSIGGVFVFLHGSRLSLSLRMIVGFISVLSLSRSIGGHFRGLGALHHWRWKRRDQFRISLWWHSGASFWRALWKRMALFDRSWHMGWHFADSPWRPFWPKGDGARQQSHGEGAHV